MPVNFAMGNPANVVIGTGNLSVDFEGIGVGWVNLMQQGGIGLILDDAINKIVFNVEKLIIFHGFNHFYYINAYVRRGRPSTYIWLSISFLKEACEALW